MRSVKSDDGHQLVKQRRTAAAHIHENLLLLHVPKVHYYIEIWSLWRPFEYNELRNELSAKDGHPLP